MSTMIENAIKGQRSAMQYLYENNKQKVYYLAKSLLSDEAQAAEAVTWVFREMWMRMALEKIAAEEDFSREAVRKAVSYCKRKVTNQNAKAFRVPQNKNFLLTPGSDLAGREEPVTEVVLGQFTELQRFILVLRVSGKYSQEEMAQLFRLDQKIIGIALEAEKINVEKILQAAESKEAGSHAELVDLLVKKVSDVKVPAKADEQAAVVIDGIAGPLEQKKRRQTILAGVVAAAVCLGVILGVVIVALTGKKDETAGVEDGLTYYADIEIQDYGTITIQLNREEAPITTANFISLAESGFYDGLTFHRIIENFMMQGGDPKGDGTGGSGNKIVGEFSSNGYDNDLTHTRGAVSMARAEDPDSASSQFFIVHEDSPHLNGDYAVFGYVTDGMEVVDEICESAVPIDKNGTIPAEDQPVITAITVWAE